MGGSDKGQKKANAQMEQENAVRQREIDASNLESEKSARGLEYTSGRTRATGDARRKAEGAITSERSEGIKKYSQMQTDYNNQERRRLFEAKKGQGQVGAGDTAITGAMMREAKEFLGREQDYWDASRTSAGDKAYGEADAGYLSEFGSEEAFVRQGKLATGARERGRTARSKDKEAPQTGRIQGGQSLLGRSNR